MVDSLRDQLLKSGIVKPGGREPPPDKLAGARKPRPPGGNPPRKSQRHARGGAPAAEEIGLAKAYALRSQTQNRERQQLERAAAEQAKLRRERKTHVQELLAGRALNKLGAEHPRHFEYAGKIRRVYVDAEQLRALNAGQLAIVQQGGHYLVVDSDIARQVQAIDARVLALLVNPEDSPASMDGVPDDLMW